MSSLDQGRCEGGFVGCTLRSLRAITRMSQRELANRAGVTHSAISQIEQGLISPSIQFLHKVLCGVPMTLSTFFRLDLCRASGDVLIPCKEASNTVAGIKNCSARFDSGDKPLVNKKKNADILMSVLPPDEFEPLLCQPTRTLIWCSRGAITVRYHQGDLTMAPGNSLLFEENDPFVVGNLSRSPAEYGMAELAQAPCLP